MVELELYFFPQSSPSRAVNWFIACHREQLDKAGVKIEKKVISLPNKEFMTPEYFAVNKYQTVPALREVATGKVYTESGAILYYLARLAGSEEVPSVEDIGATASMFEAMLHHESLARSVSDVQRRALNAGRLKPEETTLAKQHAMVVEDGWASMVHKLSLLERVLSETRFIAGDSFTIADRLVLSELSRLRPSTALHPSINKEGAVITAAAGGGGEKEEKDEAVPLPDLFPKVFQYIDTVAATKEGWAEFVEPVLKNFKNCIRPAAGVSSSSL